MRKLDEVVNDGPDATGGGSAGDIERVRAYATSGDHRRDLPTGVREERNTLII
ncbi:hypothetical protein [Mycobacterium neglectum]|uniref:hypothetical protein n=1 Tax=Mycobacterium neglectum TaxID=242737 RepID=UPI003183D537